MIDLRFSDDIIMRQYGTRLLGLNANLSWLRDTITLIMLSDRDTEGQLALFANFIRPNFLVINAAESKPVPSLGWLAGWLAGSIKDKT